MSVSTAHARARSSTRLALAFPLGLVFALVGWIGGSATPAGAASIGLSGSVAAPVVVTGGSTTLEATVTNTDGSGGGNLVYDVNFAAPGGPYIDGGQLPPGGSDTWQAPYDSAGQPLGLNLTTVTASDPGASNSPQNIELGVTVLDHAKPFLYTPTGKLLSLGAKEPPVDYLAFGATGGGESFAATAYGIVNDPPQPTAALDLDTLSATGDSQISADLTAFSNLASNDDPSYGHFFNVLVDVSKPGTFTKTFYLGFSDQDLPGATAPGSILTSFTIVATVVPEPASAALVALGLAGLAVAGDRRAARRARSPGA